MFSILVKGANRTEHGNLSGLYESLDKSFTIRWTNGHNLSGVARLRGWIHFEMNASSDARRLLLSEVMTSRHVLHMTRLPALVK